MKRNLVRASSGEGLGAVVRELHRDESRLVQALVDLSDKHAADHEIHFVARDLAAWSREHVRRLADLASSYSLDLDGDPRGKLALPGAAKRATSKLVGRDQAPMGLLLADLRDLHARTAAVSLDWEILAQGAQAAEDGQALALASECHPQTLRQLRWTNAQLKELAPQAVGSRLTS